jgi:hypothetical protein
VIRSGQFDVGGVRDVFREVPGVADIDPGVTCAVQDQRRQVNPRQEIPNIEPHVHPDDVLRHGRARRHPQVSRPPRAVPRVI